MKFIKQLIPWHRLDWMLLLCLAGLMTFGVFFVYSATYNNDTYTGAHWLRMPHYKQIIFYILGIGAAFVLCLRDYQQTARWANVFYWLSLIMLVAVLIPGIGSVRFGARRWFDLGVTQFQPSELAKVAVVLALAQFLSRPPKELKEPKVLLKALALASVPFALIFMEPDLGSALTLLPPALVMLYVAGVPGSFLRKLVGGCVIFVSLVLAYVFFIPKDWKPIRFPDYQKRRLMVYFNVDYASQYTEAGASQAEIRRARALQRQDSYNVVQAMISVGSGGLTGKGWKQGIQNTHGYLPRGVAHNDFIFSVIAEESGFVGSTLVILLYGGIIVAGIRTASQCRDRLGRLIAIGVVTLLFSHVFVNIGMNIRMVPVTGLPLPLLSSGGSSVVCSLLSLGLLQNVRLYQRTI
jgi:rod shape determining protein RodA